MMCGGGVAHAGVMGVVGLIIEDIVDLSYTHGCNECCTGVARI